MDNAPKLLFFELYILEVTHNSSTVHATVVQVSVPTSEVTDPPPTVWSTGFGGLVLMITQKGEFPTYIHSLRFLFRVST